MIIPIYLKSRKFLIMRCLPLNVLTILIICLSANIVQSQKEEIASWGVGINLGLNTHKSHVLDYGITLFLPNQFQVEASFSRHQYLSSDIATLRKRLEDLKSIEFKAWTIGVNRPIHKSNWVWVMKFAQSSFRSEASEKWYDYKDRPYQKRISTHHDINVYNLIGGIAWRPELSKNRWYLDISLLPSLQWYRTPAHRNSDDDSRWAVRQDFLSDPNKAYKLSWHFRLAFIYRIFNL